MSADENRESRTDRRQDDQLDDQQEQLDHQQEELDEQGAEIGRHTRELTEQALELQEIDEKLHNVEFEAEKGGKQRFRIHNPTPEVTLSMGEPNETVGYVGFNAVAQNNVFVSANTGRMFMQSQEQMVLQTPDDMVLQAQKEILLGSTAETYITAKKGVVILGGEGPSPTMAPVHGEEPPKQDLSSFQKVAQGIETWGKWREGGLAALGAALAIAGADRTRASISMAAGPIAGAVSAIKEAMSPEGSPVVAVHGDNGVSVVSPNGGVSIAGSWGVGICGVGKVEMVSPLAAEVFGGSSAGIVSAGKTGVESGFLSEVLSLKKVEIAARTGECELMGKEIGIGKKSPHNALVKAANQLPTEGVSIEATKHIALNSDEAVHVHSKDVHVHGESKVAIGVKAPPPPSTPTGAPPPPPPQGPPDAEITVATGTKKVVEIAVGHFKVVVDGTGNKILIGKAAAEDGEPTDPLVEINGGEKKITVGAGTCGMTVTPDRTAVGTTSHYVSIEKSGTMTLKGVSIKIG